MALSSATKTEINQSNASSRQGLCPLMVKLGEPWTEGMGGRLTDETGFPYFRAKSLKALDPAALTHPCAALSSLRLI